MECTFISIHDLSLDARLLYVSTSIEDILGYKPAEIVGKSCWEYFHPDEIPFAQSIHGRSIRLDKAAVLNYCQIKNRQGRWVGCECVFTIVHDVLVASTSVYRRGPGSQKRAIDAPVIRQLFSSSPRDPRYHMLSYISSKFSQDIPTHINEPRAALFLNRFSRTLAIMYATNGLADVLGISADRLIGKSFYFCIQENCLREAVKCLESAKANDSIAYLRFWFRDPTQNSRQNSTRQDEDDPMTDGNSSADEDDGGVHLSELMDHDGNENAIVSDSSNSMRSSSEPQRPGNFDPNSRSSSGNSTDVDGGHDNIFDPPANGQSRTSSVSTPDGAQSSSQSWSPEEPQIELEAVVSCTSDGLVVILRRAKPLVPHIATAVANSSKSRYNNGIFASPWANDPIMPILQDGGNQDPMGRTHQTPIYPTAAVPANPAITGGPASEDFMNSIREVAVFAWSLTGINGSLEQYGRGKPIGESLPSYGYPVWDPNSNAGPEGYSTGDRFVNRYERSLAPEEPFGRREQGNSNNTNGHGANGAKRNSEYNYNLPSLKHRIGQSIHSSHEVQTPSFTNGHSSNGANGYHDQGRQMNPIQHNQGTAYGSAQKSIYNHESPKNRQATTPAYGQNPTNGFSNGNQSAEYDPYAPAAYEGSAMNNHDSFVESHTGNGWHVNSVVPAQRNGYHR